MLDSFTGREPDEQEIQRRQVEGMWDALEDGSAVNQPAEGQATYDRWIGQLKAANPGIVNPEAIEEMGPILEGIAEVYGPQPAYEPVVIEQAVGTAQATALMQYGYDLICPGVKDFGELLPPFLPRTEPILQELVEALQTAVLHRLRKPPG